MPSVASQMETTRPFCVRGALASGLIALVAFLQPAPALAANCKAGPASGVDWTDCQKRNLILTGSDLSNSQLGDVDFSSTDLRDTNLSGANFNKAALARAMLNSSKAAGANFEKALGYRTSFVETDLTGANFTKSEMQRADFSNAILAGADFTKTELGRVVFAGADINNTAFSYANLARADFRGSKFDTPIDFADAYFYRTRFEGVDLSKATGIEQWQIDLACGDENTVLPEGLERPGGWPCEEE